MKLTVLGKSPAWTDAGGACSGYLVEAGDGPGARARDGRAFLLDCGNGVFGKLRARRDYRARIRELQEEIDEARGHNDPLRAERLEAELDVLVQQLSSAFGLSGRERPTASASLDTSAAAPVGSDPLPGRNPQSSEHKPWSDSKASQGLTKAVASS